MFDNLIARDQLDPHAQIMFTMGYVPELNFYASGVIPMYVRSESDAAVFREYRKIKKVYSSNRVANLTSFYPEVSSFSPGSYR